MLKKVSRTVKTGIIVLEILLVLTVFALVYNFFLPIGKGDRITYFHDRNLSSVLNTLTRHGYNITDWDHLLFKKKNLPKKGWYRIGHTNEGRYHFFNKLNKYPLPVLRLRVYAGETRKEMLHRLATDMKLDEAKLNKFYETHAHYPEGEIISGLYTIAKEANENQTLSFLFEQSDIKRKSFFRESYINKLDNTSIKILLTIASIIQKESNNPDEMPLISSVIYNRLERGMKLQMDGTLNYGEYSHCVVTPERIKTDTSFYNTYKYKGLPPAPLGTVSIEALKAAMFPAKSNLLFFMLHKDGSHKFSETYTQHLAYIKAFRKYQKDQKKIQEKNTTICSSLEED